MYKTGNNKFAKTLLRWHKNHKRNLPWKSAKSPYFTWLSEIILQQTQVAQGLPYYLKISSAYPTVAHLAHADLSEIMKLWEGLGYYSRARNLHTTAKYIAYELKGDFPDTYEGLLKLKGVGDYTAAAIASFSYDLPHAVVDGNVFRFLSRLYGIKKPIDTTEGKKYFSELANKLLDRKNPAEYNQAIMNFGSMVCTPKQPLCHKCPFAIQCIAKSKNSVNAFPVKQNKLVKKTRCFTYLVINYDNKIYLNHRTENDIWKNLYDFPVVESSKLLNEKSLTQTKEWKGLFKGKKAQLKYSSADYVQQLSHQTIKARFYTILINSKLDKKYAYHLADRNMFKNQAFPKIIRDYLKSITNFIE